MTAAPCAHKAYVVITDCQFKHKRKVKRNSLFAKHEMSGDFQGPESCCAT